MAYPILKVFLLSYPIYSYRTGFSATEWLSRLFPVVKKPVASEQSAGRMPFYVLTFKDNSYTGKMCFQSIVLYFHLKHALAFLKTLLQWFYSPFSLNLYRIQIHEVHNVRRIRIIC